MNSYLSVTEYAELHQKDVGNIRRLLASGRLPGQKVGHQWIIPSDAAYPADKRETTGLYRNWRRKSILAADKPLMKTLNALVYDLRFIYGDMLNAVVLYGSYARGTQTEESDIDIAVILSGKPEKAATTAMIECVAGYELVCGKVLSVIDINADSFHQWQETIPFYRNIRKEGIPLWKSAA